MRREEDLAIPPQDLAAQFPPDLQVKLPQRAPVPMDPRIAQTGQQIDAMDQPAPQPKGLQAVLAPALKGLSYGAMNPAQAQQLEQQKIGQEFAQKQARRQALVQQYQDLQNRQRQAETDDRAMAQDEREQQLHPLQMRQAEAQATGAELGNDVTRDKLNQPIVNIASPGSKVIIRHKDGREEVIDVPFKPDAAPAQVPGRDVPFPKEVEDQKIRMNPPSAGASQQPNTPFEVWQQQNPGAPVQEWIKANANKSARATVSEHKALGFFDRIYNAKGNIDGMEAEINKLGIGGQARLNMAPNFAQTPLGKRYNQAREDFINASLRRESGAAIAQSEYDRFDRIYFPVPGDDLPTLAQKKQAREAELNSIKREAGTAYTETYGDDEQDVPPPIAPPKGQEGPASFKLKDGRTVNRQPDGTYK